MLRNPVYIGKIRLRATKDEGELFVKGLHEPIVDNETFINVQDILDGRRKKNNLAKIHKSKPELPLRGFLVCPRCGTKLTGSASKGHGGLYYYYHCVKGCKERHRANLVNEKFMSLLGSIQPNEDALNLYNIILKDVLSENEKGRKESAASVQTEMGKIKDRINSLQDKLADNQINISDYTSARQRYDVQLRELQQKLVNMVQLNKDIYEQLTNSFSFLKDLPSRFLDAGLEAQQRIIGSIFPGKLFFSENKVRTSKVNEVVTLFASIGAPFGRNKKGRFCEKAETSFEVTPIGFKPITF